MPFYKGSGYNGNWNNELPKKIKKKAMKFKLKMLFILVMLLILAVLLGGCITSPGKKLTGVVPTGHGTYRLQSAVDREKREAAAKKTEEAKRKALLEAARAKQVKLPHVKSKPVPPKFPEVKAPHVPPKSAVHKVDPVTSKVKEEKLSPAEVLIEDLKNVGKENSSDGYLPVIIDEDSANGEKPKVKVDLMALIEFYAIALIFIVIVYLGYRIARKKTKALTKKAPLKRAKKTRKKTKNV